MAWLDNSPVGQGRARSHATNGRKSKNNGVVRSLSQLPIVGPVLDFSISIFLFGLLTIKLSWTGMAIKRSSFEKTETITPLLRTLFYTKQRLPRLKQTKLRTNLYTRSELLKRKLVSNSYQAFIGQDKQQLLLGHQKKADSTQYLLSLMQATVAKVEVPDKLYWTSQTQILGQGYSLNLLPHKKQPFIYLQGACHQLVQLLSVKNKYLSLNEDHNIKVSREGFEQSRDDAYASGICIKLLPRFSALNQQSRKTATFWDQQPGKLHLQSNELSAFVHSLFFQTFAYYQEFVAIVNQEGSDELKQLVIALEAKQHIEISDLMISKP